jgi:hypothetical protein
MATTSIKDLITEFVGENFPALAGKLDHFKTIS